MAGSFALDDHSSVLLLPQVENLDRQFSISLLFYNFIAIEISVTDISPDNDLGGR
jgi:hypothetical protein